ncbi:DUF4258 domain-containing protein [Urechidicola croceus]|uniref:DUF4258 domain-containing protein n=1 Tax=Urechidicola croceus TaxID=1850246 RepID=A0A1D8P4Z6_9FLAO|nr:DUF4258 domain-containing protein [Urechidicola croceus]AOW19637.1 hypothetical protein LPB138_02610 [Urechidicola croceus]
MRLLHKLAYFGIGLLISSVLVYFIWGKKKASFDYLPNARVLKALRMDVRKYSPQAINEMITIGIDSTDISAILEYGKIDFKKSSPRKEPCKIYFINGKPNQKDITLMIKRCDTISTIHQVIQN